MCCPEILNSPLITKFAPLAKLRVLYAVGVVYVPEEIASALYKVLFESNGINNVTPAGIVYVPASNVVSFNGIITLLEESPAAYDAASFRLSKIYPVATV